MSATVPFKRLILRAVPRGVSPMVARLISASDDTELTDLHDVFQRVLGWSGNVGYSFRIHGREFNSFRRHSSFRLSPLRDSSLALPASIIVTLHYPSYLTSKIQSWSSNGSFLMRVDEFPRSSGATLRQKSPSAT